MPIELSPGPTSLRYDRHIPYAPSACMGWANSPMRQTGPARAIDCVPGRVKPNGLVNPWARYGGETYTPSSEVAANIQANSYAGGNGGGGLPGGYSSIVGDHVRGGSTISPRSAIGGSLAGGSIRSYHGSLSGGPREGWDGILERNHRGHEPDPTSPAAGLPRSQQPPTNWLHTPSSPMNHARMSPSLAIQPPSQRLSPNVFPSSANYPASSMYLQPPVANHHPRRSSSVKAVPIDDYCAECCPSCVESRRDARHETARSKSGAHPLRLGSSLAGSPLRPVNGTPVARMVSRSRSGRSDVSGKHCSECSA